MINEKTQVSNLKPMYDGRNDYTQLGEARVFAQEYGDTHICFCPNRNLIDEDEITLIWKGHVWKVDRKQAKNLVSKLLDRQLDEAWPEYTKAYNAVELANTGGDEVAKAKANALLAKAAAYKDFIYKQRNASSINKILDLACAEMEHDFRDFDADPLILNTPNGVIDLTNGSVRPNRPEDLCMMSTTVPMNGNSLEGKEEFHALLRLVTEHTQEDEDFLQMLAGLCLFGKSLDAFLMICFGSGGNGKSTLFLLLAMILGDYAITMDTKSLLADKRTGKDFDIVQLYKKRLAIFPECKKGEELDDGVLKKISSSDMVRAEGKFKQSINFAPSATPIFFTNNLPRVSTTDQGTWDRIHLMHFKHRFRENGQQIEGYAEHLYQVAGPYVLWWAVQGAIKVYNNGFKLTFPKSVITATANYRGATDPIARFALINLEKTAHSDDIVSAETIYKAYNTWCDVESEPVANETAFGRRLKDLGYLKKQGTRGELKGKTIYIAVKLVEQEEE